VAVVALESLLSREAVAAASVAIEIPAVVPRRYP
jgi:hypothetical protein